MSITNDVVQNNVQTVGLQTISGVEYGLPENCAAKVTANVICIDDDNGDIAGFELNFMAKRESGNAVIVGTVTASLPGAADLSMITSAISAGINGNNVKINVTGILLKTINWNAQLQLRILTED